MNPNYFSISAMSFLHAFLAQKGHWEAQIHIYRAKQTRKSRLRNGSRSFLYMLKPNSPEEPWRRASVPDAWLSLLPFFFFFHVDLIQSTHFSSFFKFILGNPQKPYEQSPIHMYILVGKCTSVLRFSQEMSTRSSYIHLPGMGKCTLFSKLY